MYLNVYKPRRRGIYLIKYGDRMIKYEIPEPPVCLGCGDCYAHSWFECAITEGQRPENRAKVCWQYSLCRGRFETLESIGQIMIEVESLQEPYREIKYIVVEEKSSDSDSGRDRSSCE